MKTPVISNLIARVSDSRFGLLKLACLLFLAAPLLPPGNSAADTLPDRPRVEPYFHVEGPGVYDMGVISNLGAERWDAENQLDLLIATNFHHDGIKLEISNLEHVEADAEIGKERVYVRQLHKDMYKPMSSPVPVTGAMAPGVVDLALDFRVRPSFTFAPGRYSGVLTVTFTGP